MGNDFYRAFEERHRGSRELIKTRLRVYLPFVEPFKGMGMPLKAFDIGCGRGEWIEIMMESGFETVGIDLDERMLETCIENGLPGRKGDAIEALKSMEDESHTVITAFHVVEHMQFEDLQVVVEEAFRVLMPGGLFILETPNPENIAVATKGFYSDPTHKRPIPPELLSFLVEYRGFKRVKVLRLNEPEGLTEKDSHSLSGVIYGVSRDYAVVAQKAASREMLVRFDQAFDREYGTRLETLAKRYDQSIFSNIGGIEKKFAEAEDRFREVESRLARVGALARKAENLARESEFHAVSAEDRFREAESRLARVETLARKAEDLAREAEHRAGEARNTIQSVYATWSWRIAAPAGWFEGLFVNFGFMIRIGVDRAVKAGIKVLRIPLSGMIHVILKRPRIRLCMNRQFMRFPRIHKHLLGVLGRAALLPGLPVRNGSHGPQGNAFPLSFSLLTPRTHRIYQELEAAMEDHKEDKN